MAEKICQASQRLDLYGEYDRIKASAFNKSIPTDRLESLICRYFVKEDGGLTSNLDFDRSCWFTSYKRVLRRLKIHECDDFYKVGADSNFVNSCNEIIGQEMAKSLAKQADNRVAHLISSIKARMFAAFEDTIFAMPVQRALTNILARAYVAQDLTSLDIHWEKTQDFCEEIPDADFCYVFSQSQKKILRLGGNIFLPSAELENAIAEKIAEYVGEAIFKELYSGRLLTYMTFFQNSLYQNQLERLIARSTVEGESLNSTTNTTLVLSKYFESLRTSNKTGFSKAARYFCRSSLIPLEEGSQESEELNYSTGYFKELSSIDRIKVLACPVPLI